MMYLNDMPILMIAKMYKKLSRQQQYILTEYNLTEQQLLYLIIIYKSEDGIRLSDLGELLEIDKSNITRTIKQLEAKGYVIRDVTKPGERKFKLFLSEKGQKLAASLWQRQNELKQRVSAEFLPEELAVIMRFFEKMFDVEI